MSSSELQIINSDCIVIGGGITGLIIATLLQQRGIKITILDQAQDIGGRLATCRLSLDQGNSFKEGVFDYGIQSFSITSPQFQVWVDDWFEQKLIKEWGQDFPGAEGQSYYCGVQGINGIAQYLAQNLDVHTNAEVTEFNYHQKWSVNTKEAGQYQGDMLVMTTPIPQSLALLDASLIVLPLEDRFSLEQIEYDRCIAVLVLLEQPSKIPSPGGIALEDDALVWLTDNYHKGISPDGYGVTLLANPQFSDDYWDSDDAEIAYKLITAAADYLDSTVIKYQVHRWRYSSPRTFVDESCLGLRELPLVMAGDAFVAPTVEGAVLSAIAASELISERFHLK